LVCIAHHTEQMIEPFGCHCSSYCFEYFHLSFSFG
jgi:hypothetical protein